jgi:hypothetical protein
MSDDNFFVRQCRVGLKKKMGHESFPNVFVN